MLGPVSLASAKQNCGWHLNIKGHGTHGVQAATSKSDTSQAANILQRLGIADGIEREGIEHSHF